MITFNDVTIPTQAGQFWAWLNPLSLLKVLYGGEVTSFKLWQAGLEDATDMSIICPLNENFCLLRFSHPYTDEEISKDLLTDFTTRTGDVFELRNKMLAFGVLEGEGVTLYTDEKMPSFNDGHLVHSVVQRGPGVTSKSSIPSRYRRIINAHNPNLPLIQPMDRIVLQPEESDLVLFPDSHPRFATSVFSNLKASY